MGTLSRYGWDRSYLAGSLALPGYQDTVNDGLKAFPLFVLKDRVQIPMY